MTDQLTYPYDPTGTASTNLRVGEIHHLNYNEGLSGALLVPRQMPFYRNNLRLVHVSSGKVLVQDRDYTLTHNVLDLSSQLNIPVYASITVTNNDYVGNIEIDYQTLGGEFSIDSVAIAESAIYYLELAGSYPWSKIKNPPEEFPADPHDIPTETVVGFDELVDAVDRLNYGAPKAVPMANVLGLTDALGATVGTDGTYKIFNNVSYRFRQPHNGSAIVRLPKFKEPTRLRLVFKIVDGDGQRELIVSGMVKAYSDGIIGEHWVDVNVERTYNTWETELVTTYDQSAYPCVFLGKNSDFVNTTVSLVEVFASKPDVVVSEGNIYSVKPAATLNGMDYISATPYGIGDEDDIITRPQVEDLVQRRHRNILPVGIHSGFNIIRHSDNQIAVGSPDTTDSAIVDTDDGDITVIGGDEYHIITLAGPGVYDIRLSISDEMNSGNLQTDRDDRGGEIINVSVDTPIGNQLRIGRVTWPANEANLASGHIDNTIKQTASFGDSRPPCDVVPTTADMLNLPTLERYMAYVTISRTLYLFLGPDSGNIDDWLAIATGDGSGGGLEWTDNHTELGKLARTNAIQSAMTEIYQTEAKRDDNILPTGIYHGCNISLSATNTIAIGSTTSIDAGRVPSTFGGIGFNVTTNPFTLPNVPVGHHEIYLVVKDAVDFSSRESTTPGLYIVPIFVEPGTVVLGVKVGEVNRDETEDLTGDQLTDFGKEIAEPYWDRSLTLGWTQPPSPSSPFDKVLYGDYTIAVSGKSSAIINENGKVYIGGEYANTDFVPDDGENPNPVTPEGALQMRLWDGPEIERVFAGGGQDLFFQTTDGTTYCMGNNRYGSLGLGDEVERFAPTLNPNITGKIKWLSCISDSTLFLLESGELYISGFTATGDPDNKYATETTPVLLDTGVIEATQNGYAYFWRKSENSDAVWAQGELWEGTRLDYDIVENSESVIREIIGTGYTGVFSGQHHLLTIDTAGVVRASGSTTPWTDSWDGVWDDVPTPIVVMGDAISGTIQVFNTGIVYQNQEGRWMHFDWSYNLDYGFEFEDVPNATNLFRMLPELCPDGSEIERVHLGRQSVHLLSVDGNLYAAGSNAEAKLGVGISDWDEGYPLTFNPVLFSDIPFFITT